MSGALRDRLSEPLAAGPDSRLILAEIMATRLCHDMAGLVATVAGTLEMALEDTDGDGEAASLAIEASGQLAARVRLYRAAWGGGDMEQDGIAGLAEGLPNRARLNLAIDPALSDGRLPPEACRLVLCVLLAATAGLPTGGDVMAARTGRGFSILLAGRNAAWPAGIEGQATDLAVFLERFDARGLAVPMAALVAAAAGWQLTLDGMRLVATPPG